MDKPTWASDHSLEVCGQYYQGFVDDYNIPVNRPESGGTVPIFAAMSRCPAKHFTCPNSFGVAKFVRLFASTLVYGGHARKKGVARSCACILS